MQNVKTFDLGIIGLGVAGAFSLLRASELNPNASIVGFELGRPPGKRRRQLEGWLGCFPFSDGKLVKNDSESLLEAENDVLKHLEESGPIKLIKDRSPEASVMKRISKLGLQIKQNDYIQWKPENIHKLSRYISTEIEKLTNASLRFDEEVYSIVKENDEFIITSEKDKVICKKLIIATGRSGWRWSNRTLKSLGVEIDDSVVRAGIKVEIPAQYMKEFNKSHCSFVNDDYEIGTLDWNGTVVPEDHADLVISSFRSNEDRWKTSKVSFNLIKNVKGNKGIDETDRLGKLAFLLSNDRIGREKTKVLLNKTSAVSLIPEFDWLVEDVKKFEALFPSIITRGYFHLPAISTKAGKFDLSDKFETNVEGLYVVGENAGFDGLYKAILSGYKVMKNIME